MIVNKYGLNGNWVSNSVNSTYKVSAWRKIRNLWPDLSRNIVYKVGMGRKNLFWKENWNGNEALMVLFPDLFSLCTNPEETVAEVWSIHGWNIVFGRHLNDWEIGRVAELLNVLSGFNGLSADKDSIRWKHSRDERLSVNKLYIKEMKEHPGGKLGPWKQIRRNKVPTKV